MKSALLAALLALAACGDDTPPAPDRVGLPTTTEPAATVSDIAELRAELLRVESELHTANTDRDALKKRVAGLYVERASRAATRARATRAVYVAGGDVWARLRHCESGGNYAANTGNGYYGAYQFSAATWRSMGTGYAYAHLAPPAVQDDAARRLQARSGWSQWPACSRKLGLA